MSVMTLGDRPLLQLHADGDSISPIKAIKVTKIGNLDVIFILTVCNNDSQELVNKLRDTIPAELPEAIRVSDSTFLLPSNVVVVSVRVPISGPLVTPEDKFKWFNAVAKLLDNLCGNDYPNLLLHLQGLINAGNPQLQRNNDSQLLYRFAQYSTTIIQKDPNYRPKLKPK